MRRRSSIFLGGLFVGVLGVVVWLAMRPQEPEYQGKRLDKWLDEYNRAEAMEKTTTASDAIRAMGTNSLPFLLAHIRHEDSAIKKKFFDVVRRQHALKLPFYGTDPYRSTSIMALRALDSQAAPLCPDLLKVAENPDSHWWGMMALLAIGTNSIPTLSAACQSTNAEVRTEAILMMAMLKATPPPWFSWGWQKAPVNGRPLFILGYAVGDNDVQEMIRMLKDPDGAVRRAAADSIGLYTRPPYTSVAKSSSSHFESWCGEWGDGERGAVGAAVARHLFVTVCHTIVTCTFACVPASLGA